VDANTTEYSPIRKEKAAASQADAARASQPSANTFHDSLTDVAGTDQKRAGQEPVVEKEGETIRVQFGDDGDDDDKDQ